MKVYVDLTDNELRALRSAIWNGIGACSGSCIYTEMQTKKTDCSNCPYVKALDSLREKFSKPKSLADYTKQVRKEVLGELMNMLGDRAEPIDCGGCAEFMFTTYDLQESIKEILGETNESN